MNLVIDVGNTLVKLAVFKDYKIIHKEIIKVNNLLETVKSLKKKYKLLTSTLISSVGNLDESIINSMKLSLNVLVLNSQTKLPFKNLYKTPKTLGIDRMALISASVKHYKEKNALIIDAGTCITYDFINSDNQYIGGSISPGIRMRYQSLNNLTANLPLLETKVPDKITGSSTSESIHSGIINGILNEIDGVVEEYEKRFKDLTIILTGGDADFLSKQLKSSIFAHSNFLLEGLNFILEFNSNE
jgi:type III pantothenate kinase